ncbi:response regulator [Candidatus Puniceispirillum sp.]|nr:response regulator [Candidatus Puniceispirillum sp.]
MPVKILIADDEPNQLELLSFNLTQAGFDVTLAHDGKQALTMIEDSLPDLVVLDWMMPHLSGIELCRLLRGRSDFKHLPIIILSARGEDGDKTLGLDTGADDYISKPFSPRELVARVRALLRRTRLSTVAEVIKFADMQIFPGRMEVFRAGQRIHLGPKEYQLLLIMIERPGQVFSRVKLLDLVWGHGVYVEERTVDVHLSRLRKALNKADGVDGGSLLNLIRTVRGSGYALHAESGQ